MSARYGQIPRAIRSRSRRTVAIPGKCGSKRGHRSSRPEQGEANRITERTLDRPSSFGLQLRKTSLNWLWTLLRSGVRSETETSGYILGGHNKDKNIL